MEILQAWKSLLEEDITRFSEKFVEAEKLLEWRKSSHFWCKYDVDWSHLIVV